MTKRLEFSAKVRDQAAQRANGKCEMCGLPFGGRRPEYDHILPDALGGKPTLANCRAVCAPCHKAKTATEDVPRIRKADRQRRASTAAIAVVQPEIDRLRAENEGLRRERDEAQEVADNAVEQTAVMRASLEYAEQQKLMALNNELLTRAESSEALVAELREKVVDLTHREKVRSEAINRSLTDANERADAAQARADLAIKLFDQREEYLSGLIARNAELRENNARLREALEPFAKRAERYDPDEADDGEPDWSTASPSIRIGDLRRARSELEGR